MEFLQRRIGPLPGWAWLVIAVAAIAVFMMLRRAARPYVPTTGLPLANADPTGLLTPVLPGQSPSVLSTPSGSGQFGPVDPASAAANAAPTATLGLPTFPLIGMSQPQSLGAPAAALAPLQGPATNPGDPFGVATYLAALGIAPTKAGVPGGQGAQPTPTSVALGTGRIQPGPVITGNQSTGQVSVQPINRGPRSQ